jgi:hypothetical protein
MEQRYLQLHDGSLTGKVLDLFELMLAVTVA